MQSREAGLGPASQPHVFLGENGMGDKQIIAADTKFEAAERKEGAHLQVIKSPDVDLANAKDSNIARAAASNDAPAGTVGDLQIVGDKADAAHPKYARFENRTKLNDTVTAAVGGDENKVLAFNHWMNEFENKMGRDAQFKTFVGKQPFDDVNKDMNSKIAETYKNIDELIKSDNKNAPFTKEERLILARDFMKAAAENSANADPASAMVRAPHMLSRTLKDVATRGQYTDAKGATHFLNTEYLRNALKEKN
jgi:hypothetical protein